MVEKIVVAHAHHADTAKKLPFMLSEPQNFSRRIHRFDGSLSGDADDLLRGKTAVDLYRLRLRPAVHPDIEVVQGLHVLVQKDNGLGGGVHGEGADLALVHAGSRHHPADTGLEGLPVHLRALLHPLGGGLDEIVFLGVVNNLPAAVVEEGGFDGGGADVRAQIVCSAHFSAPLLR